MTTDQSIVDGNKLIAEFMGFEFVANQSRYMLTISDFLENELASTYKFKISWDWLMPVVDKIESLNEVCDFNINYCSVYGHEVSVSNLYKNTFNPYSVKDETKIEAVYNACLKFIQYYNQKD